MYTNNQKYPMVKRENKYYILIVNITICHNYITNYFNYCYNFFNKNTDYITTLL